MAESTVDIANLTKVLAKQKNLQVKINDRFFDLNQFLTWCLICFVIFWLVAIYFIKIFTNLTFFETIANPTLLFFGTLIGFSSSGLLMGIVAWFNWGKPLVEIKTGDGFINKPEKRVVEKVVTPPIEMGKPIEFQEDNERLPDICAAVNSFLKPDAIPTVKMAAGKEVKVYKISDVQFNLKTVPHTLVVGESGGGKTVTTYNLIKMLNQTYDFPRFVIVDMGMQDFEGLYAGRTFEDFVYVLDQIYKVMLARSRPGEKKKNRQRIVWLVEEFEEALAQLKIQPKAERDKITQKLSSLARMARKTDINLLFICQSAKASDFDTSIRNNFGNRLVHRSPANLAGMFDCEYDVADLQSGIAWYNKLGAFVEFDLIDAPPINTITLKDLKYLVKSYEAQYGELSADVNLSLSTEFKDEL